MPRKSKGFKSKRRDAHKAQSQGKTEEAKREAALFMVNSPRFTISQWASNQPSRDEAALRHLADGYRKAGLPE